MKLFSMLVAAVSLFGVSCERHEFDGPEGTRQLQEHHGAGEHHATSDTPAAHGEKTAH